MRMLAGRRGPPPRAGPLVGNEKAGLHRSPAFWFRIALESQRPLAAETAQASGSRGLVVPVVVTPRVDAGLEHVATFVDPGDWVGHRVAVLGGCQGWIGRDFVSSCHGYTPWRITLRGYR